MYTAEYFKDKRVILTKSPFEECDNKRTIITEVKDFGGGNLLLKTDLPHPKEKNSNLWVELWNVLCILEYHSYHLQYRNKQGETLMLPYTSDEHEKQGFELIGHFDMYTKIYIDLLERPELIPTNIQNIFDKWGVDNGLDYDELGAMLIEVERNGYTFDYGLSAEIINLRKL